MITLNILTQEQKNEVVFKTIYEFIKKILIILISAAIIYAGAMISAKIYMQKAYVKTVEDSANAFRTAGSVKNVAGDINDQTLAITEMQKSFYPTAGTLEQISLMVPNDIKISSLIINKNTKDFSISGNARTRDGLLALKEAIEKKDTFSDIDFPLKNILEKENINFTIKAKIKL